MTSANAKVVRVPVIEAIDLRRTYQTTTGVVRRKRLDVEAVRGISFSVEQGELFFLDEPTIGVDPVGARDLRQMIADLVTTGKTVLLTTHYMFEADALCDRIAVIAKGEIVGEGTPAALKSNVIGGRVTEIEVF